MTFLMIVIMVLLKYACNRRVQAIIIKTIYAWLRNIVRGLLYTSTANKAASMDPSSILLVYLSLTPYWVICYTSLNIDLYLRIQVGNLDILTNLNSLYLSTKTPLSMETDEPKPPYECCFIQLMFS